MSHCKLYVSLWSPTGGIPVLVRCQSESGSVTKTRFVLRNIREKFTSGERKFGIRTGLTRRVGLRRS